MTIFCRPGHIVYQGSSQSALSAFGHLGARMQPLSFYSADSFNAHRREILRVRLLSLSIPVKQLVPRGLAQPHGLPQRGYETELDEANRRWWFLAPVIGGRQCKRSEKA